MLRGSKYILANKHAKRIGVFQPAQAQMIHTLGEHAEFRYIISPAGVVLNGPVKALVKEG